MRLALHPPLRPARPALFRRLVHSGHATQAGTHAFIQQATSVAHQGSLLQSLSRMENVRVSKIGYGTPSLFVLPKIQNEIFKKSVLIGKSNFVQIPIDLQTEEAPYETIPQSFALKELLLSHEIPREQLVVSCLFDLKLQHCNLSPQNLSHVLTLENIQRNVQNALHALQMESVDLAIYAMPRNFEQCSPTEVTLFVQNFLQTLHQVSHINGIKKFGLFIRQQQPENVLASLRELRPDFQSLVAVQFPCHMTRERNVSTCSRLVEFCRDHQLISIGSHIHDGLDSKNQPIRFESDPLKTIERDLNQSHVSSHPYKNPLLFPSKSHNRPILNDLVKILETRFNYAIGMEERYESILLPEWNKRKSNSNSVEKCTTPPFLKDITIARRLACSSVDNILLWDSLRQTQLETLLDQTSKTLENSTNPTEIKDFGYAYRIVIEELFHGLDTVLQLANQERMEKASEKLTQCCPPLKECRTLEEKIYRLVISFGFDLVLSDAEPEKRFEYVYGTNKKKPLKIFDATTAFKSAEEFRVFWKASKSIENTTYGNKETENETAMGASGTI